jgi:hypothetical protein
MLKCGCGMQDMDRDVLRLGRELALCTLDVQLDALYLTLEEEVRQILDVEAGSEISGDEPAAALAQVLVLSSPHLLLLYLSWWNENGGLFSCGTLCFPMCLF